MVETSFQRLSATERRDALDVAARRGGRETFLLEKDTWVVAALGVLFEAPFGRHLVFKGGTSLSKVWRAIRRFSEDLDITYDIRGFAPDLVVGGDQEAIPPTRSQERRWTRAIRPRLAEWVRDTAGPLVREELERAGFPARVRTEAERLYIGYEPLFEPRGIVRPEVQVDFGARSTGEPHAAHPVVCDAAAHLPGLAFPEAMPATMLPERTFWEKATSMHVYCLQGRVRGERWSRHWHDLVRLDDAGIAARALADRELALAVARHKAMFFRENAADRQRIDYHSAVSGNLRLVPSGTAQEALAEDYGRMISIGMLLDENEPFDALMQRCALIVERANAHG
ncbi:MAG: nucleotidyl transferase AbiEii/AbiGii toxin family protein [Gemmatimonadetes bacterium]|nr:nucleotidyl transferase AbiEii/AbiGii toxin family protein [Gemmatimonadota bacterium]MYG22562.1 nucleotidyl transferase AbiEii/AbiGii toxin family protein [Gemmatimonadota bacterium]MYJ38905.1 nucleotidyl transferase AbiEii/AbiGii toxin family protein [Gemmatimonadota bacterium]